MKRPKSRGYFSYPPDLPDEPYCKRAYRLGFGQAWRGEQNIEEQIRMESLYQSYRRGYADGAAIIRRLTTN